MKIEFSIEIPDRTLHLPYSLPSSTPEYEIADLAYLLALRYLQAHPTLSLEDVDYSWRVSKG